MLLHIRYSKNGFSLIEIIIAISIITLFTVLPILAYTSYLKKGRDEKRKNDVNKISAALESYKAEKGTYPANLEQLVQDSFLPDIPKDPLEGQKVPWSTDGESFTYTFATDDGVGYTLTTPLENGGAEGSTYSASGGSGVPGSYYQTSGAHPVGEVFPASQLTQLAQGSPTVGAPTSTPYLTSLPNGSPTVTPSDAPTVTPGSPTPTIPTTYFMKTVNLYQYQNIHGIAKSSDGGLVVAGNTTNGSTLPYIIKYAPDGSVQWSKILNTVTAGYNLTGINGIVQDTDGGYVAAASGTGTGGASYGALILIKVDGSGNLVYMKVYAATYGTNPYSITAGSNGPIIIGSSGIPRNCGASTCITTSAYVLQVNKSGNRTWDLILGDQANQGSSYFQGAHENTDGTITVVGAVQNGSNYNVFLAKLDGTGNPIWKKKTPPPGSFTSATGNGVVQTGDGGFAVAGTAGYATQNIFIQRYDANGSVLWTTAVDGSLARGIVLTSDGGFVSAGTRSDNSFIYKVDASGGLVWGKEIGLNTTYDHEAAEVISDLGNGAFGVVGTAYNDQNGYGNYTYYNTVMKFDSTGSIPGCTAQLATVSPTVARSSVTESDQTMTNFFTVSAGTLNGTVMPVTVHSAATCN